MSYILDALKKAESERRLGAIPDVHAQALPVSALEQAASSWGRPAWLAAGLATLAALGLLAWFQPWREPAAAPPALPPIPAAASASAPAPALPAAPPPLAAAPSGPRPEPAPAAQRARPAPPPKLERKSVPAAAESRAALAAARNAAAPPADGGRVEGALAARPEGRQTVAKPRNEGREARAAAPAEEARAPANKVELAKAEGSRAGAGKAPETAAAVPALAELPDPLRRDIPALTINGYIYAGNPADRSVIINGRLMHEGEQVAPGLTLEKMLPREAVMNFRGQRYRLAY